MPYLRISRARYPYECATCRIRIPKSSRYFRDEPSPFARLKGEQTSARQLCLECVLGRANAARFVESFASGQLPLGFALSPNGFLQFPPRVEIVDFTPEILRGLAADPAAMRTLTAERFERLVCDRLEMMGLEVVRVGRSTYQKDGGIDMLAWPRHSSLPLVVAVQAKHTQRADHAIGPGPVRDLSGAIGLNRLNAGMLVTNTVFTPDAKWVADQAPLLVQLRDIEDLQRWLRDDFLRDAEWRRIPDSLELCPGVTVKLPR